MNDESNLTPARHGDDHAETRLERAFVESRHELSSWTPAGDLAAITGRTESRSRRATLVAVAAAIALIVGVFAVVANPLGTGRVEVADSTEAPRSQRLAMGCWLSAEPEVGDEVAELERRLHGAIPLVGEVPLSAFPALSEGWPIERVVSGYVDVALEPGSATVSFDQARSIVADIPAPWQCQLRTMPVGPLTEALEALVASGVAPDRTVLSCLPPKSDGFALSAAMMSLADDVNVVDPAVVINGPGEAPAMVSIGLDSDQIGVVGGALSEAGVCA